MDKRSSNGCGSPDGKSPVAEAPPMPNGGPGAGAGNRSFDWLRRRNVLVSCLLLFGLVVWVYLPSLRGDFIEFDDGPYVTANAHVNSGLSLENVAWAFHSTGLAEWYPMTWLTYMLDCQLYGLKPWGYHLTNVLLHGINTVLVFLVLRGLTGAKWRSLMVADLFGLHPLRVESVAWISERKDVLSLLFWLLTLWAYGRYVEGVRSDKWRVTGGESVTSPSVVSPVTRHSPHFYALALLFFTLGLMSKSMLVTLPCVLLLLDYWPLERWRRKSVRDLVQEKAPFFLVAAIMSAVTYAVEKSGGMTSQLTGLTFAARVGNALVSYCRYLGKFFWPVDLCALYPHPGYWPAEKALAAGLFVLGVSVTVWVRRRCQPYWLVGWFWYLGTLVPVIGLVQLSMHSMADRYTYIPSIGVMVALVWGLHWLTSGWRYQAVILSGIAAVAMLGCMALTRHQIDYWKDGMSVWSHAVAVTENNYDANNRLGRVLDRQERHDEASRYYQEAVRLKPDFAEARNNLGTDLNRLGRFDEALDQFQEAVRHNPDHDQARNNLGALLSALGRFDEAIKELREAVRLNPNFVEAHRNLASSLVKRGKVDEAIRHYQESLRLKPDDAEAHNGLGAAFLRKGREDEAMAHFQKALEIQPDFADAHNNAGVALLRKGQVDEAVAHYRTALETRPGNADAHNNLGAALLRKGRLDEAIVQFQRALEIRPPYAEAHFNLGCAFRQKERVDEAVVEFRKALEIQPDFADAHHNLGDAFRQKGQVGEAISQYQEVLKLNSDSVDAHNNLGALLSIQGRLAEAIKEFREALRLQPDCAEARTNLAVALGMKEASAKRPAPPVNP